MRAITCLFVALQLPQLAMADDALEIRTTQLKVFDRSVPDNRFGALTYLGGLALNSDNRNLEALSGLHILPLEADLEQLLIVTDKGYWLTARLQADASGAPQGISDARLGALRDERGNRMLTKRRADLEGITVRPRGDALEALIVAERNQPVRAYALTDEGLAPRAQLPWGSQPPLPHGRANGPEAIVHITEGPLTGETIIFLEEALRPPRAPNAIRITDNGQQTYFQIRRLDDFAITGAAMLPGGDIIIVERFFTWNDGVKMRIRHLSAAQILAGAVEGRLLLEADGGSVIDNMEAIAVTPHENGPILTIVSDDNGNFFQRTVLLRFQVTGDIEIAGQRLTPPSPVARLSTAPVLTELRGP